MNYIDKVQGQNGEHAYDWWTEKPIEEKIDLMANKIDELVDAINVLKEIWKNE